MMGLFLSRAFVMVFGYAYPAYECFKSLEKNKPEMDQLLFWCQYWIIVSVLSIFERVGDTLISWLPFYCEAKLALFVYLWYPETKGASYVYSSFFRPYVAKHENEIDQYLLNLRTKAEDMAFLCWQKAVSYGETRFFQTLQCFSRQLASSQHLPTYPNKNHEQEEKTQDFSQSTANEVEVKTIEPVILDNRNLDAYQKEAIDEKAIKPKHGNSIFPRRTLFTRRLLSWNKENEGHSELKKASSAKI